MPVSTPSATKVITGKVRLSYVHLFEPWAANDSQEAKFSTAILIPKSDKATIEKLRAAQQAALQAGKDSKFGGKVPTKWDDTIHDGDEEADLDRNPEYAGHWYMSVSAKTRPGVVDSNVNPILDSSEVYSGCYARVSLNAFPYAVSGKKGVSFGLNHVQKLADGDFLGGRSKAEDDFDALDDEDVI
jgi:hypothetical protein